jgi:predicted phage-related endonuclease
VIGGSDIAKLFDDRVGDLYASKAYDLEPVTSDAMEAGKLLEHALLNFAEQRLGKIIKGRYRRVKGTPIGVNIDGIVEQDGTPVEAKTCGVLSEWTDTSGWGDEGTGEVPDDVVYQGHGGMMGTDRDVCHVVALIGGRRLPPLKSGFQMFRVERNEELCESIKVVAQRFWTDHVVPRVPPGDEFGELCLPTLDVLKRIRRREGSIVPVGPSIVDKWLAAKEAVAIVEERVEELKAKIIHELGDAEAGELPDGRWVTYYQQRNGGLLTDELRAAHPAIAAEFANEKTHPVMRIKKARRIEQ